MFVLAINASPRIQGNTDLIIDEILEGFVLKGYDSEKLYLDKFNIAAYRENLPEDDFEKVLEKIKSADILVLGTPIYFGSMTAQLKMMIDRFQGVWEDKIFRGVSFSQKKQKGVFISVQGDKKSSYFDNAKSIIKHFFVVTGIEYSKELFCTECEDKQAVLAKKDVLREAFEMGKNFSF
ncbi:MAG: NAD(P)H-dependent oxidoreductase [Candidatus Gygaella obscura]|nr:NAD(P)H-dependent oxidoreductase [Candidatus Gygaella obscura]